MEEQLYMDRYQLRNLMQKYPNWTHKAFADALGRSISWVRTWRKRIQKAGYENDEVLFGKPRVAKTKPEAFHPEVFERAFEIRENPPNNLQRTPGPLTIMAFLKQDKKLREKGYRLPKSTRTIWKRLRERGYIFQEPKREHKPLEPLEPGEEWAADFQSISTIPAEEDGKKQHGVEVLNVIDQGSSVWVEAKPRSDYTAETVIEEMADLFKQKGCPKRLRFDRDTRFVGSWSANDYPSAFMRFLMCLGVEPVLCPAKRPDKNPYVERLNRTFKHEGWLRKYVKTYEELVELISKIKPHYNYERPHQGRSCGNLPPKITFPDEPDLAHLPATVSPDIWIYRIHSNPYKRKINHNGSISLGRQSYYVGKKLRGRRVITKIDAVDVSVVVYLDGKEIKRMPIKGLYNKNIPIDVYVKLMMMEARIENRYTKN